MLEEDMSIHYHSFLIPKKSGGQRQIMAPNPELKQYLREFVDIIQNDFHILFHDSAYAYTKGRSTADAIVKHQQNESQWFLKIDLKDFFPSCNFNKVNDTLKTVFPLCCLYEDTKTKEALEGILRLCFVDDQLPQGTPASPLLTNLLMLPLDYEIKNKFKDFNKHYFVYTRYADDILLSCKYNFDWRLVIEGLTPIMARQGLRINGDKTRYGNRNGRNWNLGLMLNKDNNITVGHKRKKEIKAMIHNFLEDYHKGEPWSKQDTQVFLGQLSYVTQIEPDYFKHIIKLAGAGRKYDLRTASLQILRS
jgi:retron-type reverse transcriptase